MASFARVSSGSSLLELAEMKEELEKFKYYFEQEKAVNANLVKEIDCFEKALSKA